MLFDFGHIKTEVRNRLEAWIDHCLVAPTACDSLRMQQGKDVSDVTLVLDKGGQIQCQAPAASIVGLPVKAVRPALLTPLAQEAIAQVLPDNIHEARIRLYPQAIEGAWYRYSHGLKKHKGACQRIAHGHRSQLWVEVNGERHTAIEQRVAQQWDTVYLGSRDDLQGGASHRWPDTLPVWLQRLSGGLPAALAGRPLPSDGDGHHGGTDCRPSGRTAGA